MTSERMAEEFRTHTFAMIEAIANCQSQVMQPVDLEPAFGYPLNSITEILDQSGISALGCHLAHLVARHPSDLKLHLDRILLHFKAEEGDRLYGALLDLFEVLKEKGLPLRTRVLSGTRSVLSPHHFAVLQNTLHSPSKIHSLPLARWSVLSRGITDSSVLIEKLDDQQGEVRDPLQEAREFIEYSQLDNARVVLESAILESPERIELHHELLGIYHATDDLHQWRIMRGKLTHILDQLPEIWEKFTGRQSHERSS